MRLVWRIRIQVYITKAYPKNILLGFTSSRICYRCINIKIVLPFFFSSCQRRMSKLQWNAIQRLESQRALSHTWTHTHKPFSAIFNSCWLNKLSKWCCTLFIYVSFERKRTKLDVTQLQLFHLQSDNTRCCGLCLCAICPAASFFYLPYLTAQWCPWCVHSTSILHNSGTAAFQVLLETESSLKVKFKVLTLTNNAVFDK